MSRFRDWKPEEREKWPLRPGFRRNEGERPRTRAKRVIVALMNGNLAGDEPVTSVSPKGWAVETTKWELNGSAFNVDQWKPA